jgi:hypothetical protein
MKPSEALSAHRDELRQLVSRYSVAQPRVYGSVLTGKDDDERTLTCWWTPRNAQPCSPSRALSMKPNDCSAYRYQY